MNGVVVVLPGVATGNVCRSRRKRMHPDISSPLHADRLISPPPPLRIDVLAVVVGISPSNWRLSGSRANAMVAVTEAAELLCRTGPVLAQAVDLPVNAPKFSYRRNGQPDRVALRRDQLTQPTPCSFPGSARAGRSAGNAPLGGSASPLPPHIASFDRPTPGPPHRRRRSSARNSVL